MITLTLLCPKGGVGKTTLSFTLAAGLAARGKRVLLVDADGQAHSTILCKHAPRAGLYDLLVREAAWQDCVKPVDPSLLAGEVLGALTVLLGNHETMLIPQATNDYYILRSRLDEVRHVFDIVIIDTSPTPSLLNGSILLATDAVLMPTEMEFLGMQALRSGVRDVESFNARRTRQGEPPIELLGIVPTMVRAGTVEHSENLATASKLYGPKLWAPLAQRITWPEAANQRQSIFVYDKRSEAAREAWALVSQVELALIYAR